MSVHQAFIERLLYPAMERCKGNRIRAVLGELQHTQYTDIADIQTERLARLLLHCKRHVPAYKTLPATEEQIAAAPLQVLRTQVAPLSKRTFQQTAQQYIADNIADSARIANCTGGSTGEPVHFFMTRAQVETYEAARWRGLSWYGITPGSRSVMLWGNPVELATQQQRRHRWRERLLKNRVVLSAYALTAEKAVAHVRFMQRYQPDYLYGYASILTAFAQLIEEQKLTIPVQLRAVVSTSETLEAWQQALLQRVFHCPVVNEYGARDAGILAYSCPDGGLHITQENCLIEVLDPTTLQPLPCGARGLLAVTDLHGFAQPRLRYLPGDIGVLSAQRCTCGRNLALLQRIEGREDDLLVGKDGALVHGNIIGQLLRPQTDIRAFQFRQHSATRATLFIVPKDGARADVQAALLHLQPIFPETEIRVEFVPEVAPTPSGKVRYAIREFPL